MIRRHYVFSGWVQGVGFRWRAKNAASLWGCTGWVRNEWDGTVTMELQGLEAQLDRVLAAIADSRYIRIETIESRDIPVDPDERGFRTLY
jgi:acylphosphatase